MAEIKLTPITRLSMSFDHELDIDEGRQFNEKVYANYLSTLVKSEKQRDDALKFLFIVDGALAILLTGSKLSVPWLGISTTELPAILELTTALSSVVYFFFSIFFVNALCYGMVVDQFNVRIASKSALDPDFLIASEKLYMFPLKIFRSDFNFWGVDFYTPRWPFKFLAGWIEIVSSFVIIGFAVSHFCLIGYSAWLTLNKSGPAFFQIAFVVGCLVINLGGLSVFFFSGRNFKFDIIEPVSPKPTIDPQI